MPKKPPPLPPLIQLIAQTLNPIAWKYLNHEDDNASRKTKRTVSIRHARNVLKALGDSENAQRIFDVEGYAVMTHAKPEPGNDPTL